MDQTIDTGSNQIKMAQTMGQNISKKQTAKTEKANAKIWARVRKLLRSSFGEDIFNSWFARLE